jgi:hypothetical protein
MYMVEDLIDIPLGRHVAGRKYARDAFDHMREQPGFCNGQIAAYCGNLRQHMLLSFWENAEAYQQWLSTPAAAKLSQGGRPYMIRQGPGRFWELFLETRGPEQGNFLNQGILQLHDVNRWDEFVEQRREHDASAIEAGGLELVQAFRYVGETVEPHFNPTTTAILVRRTNRAAYEHSVEYGLGREVAQTKPAYKTISHQLPERAGLYDIIFEVNP